MSRKLGGEIVKEGFLIKSPPLDRPLSQRRKRYFVLWSNAILEYYSTSEKRPQDYLKTIDLTQCEDMVAPISIHGKEHIIKLSIVNKSEKARGYFLEADSRSTMDEWVKCFTRVCGFCPVDELFDEPSSPQALYDECQSHGFLVRPPIKASELPTASPNTSPALQRPPSIDNRALSPHKKALPLPPQRTDVLDIHSKIPEDLSAEYSLVSPVTEDHAYGVLEEGYEEIKFHQNDQDVNPPPVWKPPKDTTRRYARLGSIKRGTQPDSPTTKAPPPPPQRLLSQQSVSGQRSQPPTKQPPLQQGLPVQDEPRKPPLPKTRSKPPPPPAKPKQISPLARSEALTSVLRDPALLSKLQAKKEELYGNAAPPAPSRHSSVDSWSGPDPMENYEEVKFNNSLSANSHTSFEEEPHYETSDVPQYETSDVPQYETSDVPHYETSGVPQDYLTFHRSRSPTPDDVAKQRSNSAEVKLAPPRPGVIFNNGNHGHASVSTRREEIMGTVSHLVRRSFSSPRPADKPARELQGDLCNPPNHSPPQPLPTKNPSSRPRPSKPPRPVSWRNLDRPMPVPGQEPVNGKESENPPPPVPVRRIEASGGSCRHVKSEPNIQGFFYTATHLPSNRPVKVNPSTSSTVSVAPEPKKRGPPPIKPRNMNKVNKQTSIVETTESRQMEQKGEENASGVEWASSRIEKAPITKPRIPLNNKPKKPQVIPKPMHLKNRLPACLENGNIVPPLPPR